MKKMRTVFAVAIAALGLAAFGAGAEGLQAVEYLESTGNQWIDTGLNADDKLSVEIKCRFLESGVQNIFGALAGDSSNPIRHHLTARINNASSASFEYMVKNVAQSFGNDSPLEPHIHFFDAQNKTYSLDDGKPAGLSAGDFDCRANYYLFGRNALNYTGLNNVTLGRVRLYYAKFWRFENGHNTLVGDFVPAVDANGAGCLYDYVSGQAFYDAGKSNVPFTLPQGRLGPVDALVVTMSAVETSANSAHVRLTVVRAGGDACDVRIKYGLASDALTVDAPLVSGVGEGAAEGDLVGLQPEQTYYAALYGVCDDKQGAPSEVFSFRTKAADGHYPLPLGYEAVQCITVTDVGQYINTGYKPTNKTDVDLKCEVPDFTKLTSIYWTRGQGNISFGLIFVAGNAKTIRAYKLSRGTTSDFTALGADLSSPITYGTSGDQMTINGQMADFAKPTVDHLDYPIYLFGLNDSGTLNPAGVVVGTKLHYLTLKEDGVPVRIFVPCKNEKSEVGLFERVNNVFYQNSGSGGSFGFDPLAEVETAKLTVVGDPTQVGAPEPSYGVFERTPGQEIVATMDVTAVTNYLMGEERYLEGWELTVRKKSGATVVTTSEGGDKCRCPITLDAADEATLRWIWTRDAYGGCALPEGYEALDSLTFARNAAVNAKLAVSLDDRIVEVVENLPGGGINTLFCAREYEYSTITKPNLTLFDMNGKWRFDYGTSQTQLDVAVPTVQRLALAVNKGGFYQNGELVHQAERSSEQAAGPLVLQATYYYEIAEQQEVANLGNFCSSTLFAVRVWDKNDVPKANLRPCRRVADDREGLYDTVRQVFCPVLSNARLTVSGNPMNLPNAKIGYGTSDVSPIEIQNGNVFTFGTQTRTAEPDWMSLESGEVTYRVAGWKLSVTDVDGNVTVTSNDASNVTTCTFAPHYSDTIKLEWQFEVKYAGAKNANLPIRYDEVRWIQFNSNTWINTDYTPAPDKVKAAVACEIVDGDHTQAIFCSRTNPKVDSYTLLYNKDDQNPDSEGSMSMRVKNAEGMLSSAAALLGKRVKFETDRNRIRIVGGDWTTVGAFDQTFTKAGNPLTFGASYTERQGSGVNNYGTFKLYSAKFWEDGVLVRSFVPCHDKVTNVSGLYDVVTGKFYGCVNANKKGERLEEGQHVGTGFAIMLR